MPQDGLVSAVLNDARFTFRTWSRSPGLAALTIVAIVLCVAATTVSASAIVGALRNPFAFRNTERLVDVFETPARAGRDVRDLLSFEHYELYRDAVSAHGVKLAAYAPGDVFVSRNERTQPLQAAVVSGNFFAVLGARAYRGRLLDEADALAAAENVAVVSSRVLSVDGETTQVGQRFLRINGELYRVVGVVAGAFAFPRSTEVWLPAKPAATSPKERRFGCVGRLEKGVSRDAVEQLLRLTAGRLTLADSEETAGRSIAVKPLLGELRPRRTSWVWLLLATVVSCLVAGCATIAGLFLVRGEARMHEMAVRSCLGAAPARLAGQMIVEAVVLSVGSAIGGIGLGMLVRNVIRATIATAGAGDVALEITPLVVLGVTVVTVAMSALFGLVPYWRLSRARLAEILKNHAASTLGRTRAKAREGLAMAQIGIATVLLGAALTLSLSAARIQSSSSGFHLRDELLGEVALTAPRYRAVEEARSVAEQIEQALAAEAGVRRIAWFSRRAPRLGKRGQRLHVVGMDAEVPLGAVPMFAYDVSTKFFEVTGVRLLRGRLFSSEDTPASAPVAVINSRMAQRLWPGQDPIGRHLTMDAYPGDELTVIGVVEDTDLLQAGGALFQFRQPERYFPLMFRPEKQAGPVGWGTVPVPVVTVVVDLRAPTYATAQAIATAVRQIDPSLELENLIPFKTYRAVPALALNARFVAAVAIFAVGLALLGVYGVVQEGVQRRTPEFALRRALGATSGEIMQITVTETLRLALLGIASGLVVSVGFARWLNWMFFGVTDMNPSGMLYGIDAGSPVITLVASSVVLVVVLLAAVSPTWQATQVQPREALARQ